MIPYLVPRILEQIAYRFIERLAWDYISVGFDAHVVTCSGTTFDAKLHLNWVEMAVLCRCVPD
jgi:hypothetical protein